VHRPRYDDWTFPKGKLEEGETDEQAAVREVEEETGLRCELGRELPSTSYTDSKLRSKTVRYWEMRPVGGDAGPSHEVDEVRWLPLDAAERRLSYERDVELVRDVQGR
jgi:8-oxo-dGTP pyrophosphatase MutT (NUDIX family)